mmetsp:Transcript_3336/g.7801  ORF Transcript_3336/g.7801 Transcript_3336/m.7801 type:complete len:469 (-) Transcript_3336:123-1529(-)
MDPAPKAYEYGLQSPPPQTPRNRVPTLSPCGSPCVECPWPSPEPRAPLRPLNSGYSDRLIPSRAGSNLESGLDLMESGSPGQGEEASFARLLRKELLGQSSQSSDREETLLRTPERGLFRYRRKNEDDCSLLTGSTCAESPVKVQRKFPQAPYKVLSAPNLEDDYYLNVLDWSAEDNLAVGLGSSVDLWNAFSGRASRLCELDRPVASIRWSHEAGRFDRVALGLADGEVQIWDASVGQKVQSLQGHLRRTCALAWADASLFSGSQDTHIFRWDMRTPSPVQNLQGHTEEVCGLAWSKELRVLASGGNEGAVNLWTDQGELRRLGCHQAACRALAWSPKGVLATGGGTADRTIRLWTASGTQTSCVQTEAQVCSLAWSPSGDGELISTHGFSTYEVNLWKTTGGLSRLHCLQWHKARVLFLAMSPEGALVFGTGNEMLCFWHLFAKHRVSTASSSMSSEVSGLSRTIR